MKKQLYPVVLVGLFLTGCSSGVKLDDVPVVKKSALTMVPSSTGANARPVDVNQGGAQITEPTILAPSNEPGQGPLGVARIVFFDFDSYILRPEARPVIASHAQFLQKNPQRKANLEGHTDESGGREYNLALGQRRADAVRQALSLLGVPESQLEAVSYGKEKLVAFGSSEMEQAQNRRVEIRY
jgi:peptidoglycan-associated lipoprotein